MSACCDRRSTETDQATGQTVTAPGPVFIVGAARSGTSILYRTLLKHPSFAVVGDEALQLAESAILDKLHLAPRWKRRLPPRLWLFFLKNDEVYERFVERVHSLADGPPGPSHVAPPWTGDVLGEFVTHAKEARSCRRLLEKTPTHIDRAHWLLDALPTAKLLFVCRHPLDTYTSYVRRAAVDDRVGAWAELSADEFADTYRRQSRRARDLAAGAPERFLNVRYDSFVNDPAGEVGRVCTFLDEPFESEIVEEAAPDLSRGTHDPHLFGAITAKTKSWEDFVDHATATRLEDLTEDVASLWGYRRHT